MSDSLIISFLLTPLLSGGERTFYFTQIAVMLATATRPFMFLHFRLSHVRSPRKRRANWTSLKLVHWERGDQFGRTGSSLRGFDLSPRKLGSFPKETWIFPQGNLDQKVKQNIKTKTTAFSSIFFGGPVVEVMSQKQKKIYLYQTHNHHRKKSRTFWYLENHRFMKW